MNAVRAGLRSTFSTWIQESGRMRAATTRKAALETSAVQKRLIELGNTPRWEPPEQFRQTVKADRQKWAAVVKEVGATID